MITFTLLDETNTARLTLSDPRPNHFHIQTTDTLNEPRAIANDILRYARQRGIPVDMVEVATVFPAGRALFTEADTLADMQGQL